MTSEIVAEALRDFIARELLRGMDEGLEITTPLLEWGVIDSVSLVSLLAFVKQRFDVEIPRSQLKPANVATIRAITELIVRLQGSS